MPEETKPTEPAQSTDQPGQSAPAPEPAPVEPPLPSPTIQPFDATGTPPAAPVDQPKRHGHKLAIVLIVLLALAGVTAGAYAVYGEKLTQAVGLTQPTPAPSPTPNPDSLATPLKTLDTSVSEFGNSLNDADTTLDDKQGDLAE